MAGAEHVTGIEGRESLVTSAVETMKEYGVSADRYRFIAGDVHKAINELAEGFDTVFCLGFLYHTVHHMFLLSAIARLQPQDLVVDGGVCLDSDPVVRLVEEHSGRDATAVRSAYDTNDWILAGWPSVSALDMMLNHAGYGQTEYYDWQGQNLADLPDTVRSDMLNYRDGRRVTLRARKSSEGALTPRSPITQTPDWLTEDQEPAVGSPPRQ